MPRGFKWYLVGHGGTLDKMSRGRRRMRKGEPASTPKDRPVTLGIRVQEKKKKWRRGSRSFESATGDGQTCSLLGSRDPATNATQRRKRPFNRNLVSYQFRSVQALQLLVMETCNSELLPKN
jgi:hypothetical protein